MDITIEAIYDNIELRNQFELFCTKNLAEENWTFYIEYRSLTAQKAVVNMDVGNVLVQLQELYNKYFTAESAMELNIPAEMMANVRTEWQATFSTSNADANQVDKLLKILSHSFAHIEEMIKLSLLKPFINQIKETTSKLVKSLNGNKCRVIIIGGGYFGAYLASTLERSDYFQAVLIDRKAFFEMTPMIVMATVNPSIVDQVNIPYTDILKTGVFIQGEASEINEKFVSINGCKIPFHYLCLGMGTSYPESIKMAYSTSKFRQKTLDTNFRKLKEAKTVLIVGGGLVGVELAAEIKTNLPDKTVTLIDPNERIMKWAPPKFSHYVAKLLTQMGIELRLNERHLSYNRNENFHITTKGTIKADIHFMATGVKPNNQLIKAWKPELLDEKGYVKVNDNFTVQGFENIFCGGDLKALADFKLAAVAMHDAKCIATNIVRLELGKPLYRKGSHKFLSSNARLMSFTALGNKLAICIPTFFNTNIVTSFKMEETERLKKFPQMSKDYLVSRTSHKIMAHDIDPCLHLLKSKERNQQDNMEASDISKFKTDQ